MTTIHQDTKTEHATPDAVLALAGIRIATCTCGERWQLQKDSPAVLTLPLCVICNARKAKPTDTRYSFANILTQAAPALGERDRVKGGDTK